MSGKVQEKEGQISDMTQKLKVGSAEHRGDTRGVPDHLGASGGASRRSHVPCEHLPAGGTSPGEEGQGKMRLGVGRGQSMRAVEFELSPEGSRPQNGGTDL